ncbi:hypothetical protein D3C81_2109430 [compost metagenome]
MQGDRVDAVWVQVDGAFLGPLMDGTGCRTVRARKTGEAVTHKLHALGIDVLGCHGGHL